MQRPYLETKQFRNIGNQTWYNVMLGIISVETAEVIC